MPIRILIADDEPRIHAAYDDCFREADADASDLAQMGAALFEDGNSGDTSQPDFSDFIFDHVMQGEDALAKVEAANAAGDPYAMLFLDMRMPPGMDGYATAKAIRAIDGDINIAVVTGYSDHSPTKIAKVAGPLDKLYYVTKPFKTADLQQLALAVASKWTLERELRAAETALSEKVDELQEANIRISASEAQARHLALHDQMTRLPNRLYFSDHLKQLLLAGSERISVLMIDLDHFKSVNDTFGHAAGDELIRTLADRLLCEVPEHGFVARLSGDEFTIAVKGGDDAELKALAKRLLAECTRAFKIMNATISVGASIGIAFSEPGECDYSTLMRRADLALYAAKREGRDLIRWFTRDLDDNSRMRRDIEHRLRKAILSNALTLEYQPIIAPDDGEPYGYEALLRWSDEHLGQVPPSLFVPVAEQCGLSKQLGEWVIRNALAEAAKWREGIVSINVSTHHFQSSDMVGFVEQEASHCGVSLERIQFEITETAMFANPEKAAEVIIALRQSGIRIALDDFGTGYSSLVNLRDFEIDCIKIDKSFVDHVTEGGQTSAIINSVTAMARLLGVNVVAEGVESEKQVHFLRALGCGLMQGFYYSEPIAADQLPYKSKGAGKVEKKNRPEIKAA